MELLVFFATLFFFMFLGVPIALVLVLCAISLMYVTGFVDVMVISQNMVQGVNVTTLMAIPFFMFAGEIMSQGGLSHRIVKFADVIVGRIRGGMGYVAILSCLLFAGLMGSSVAAAAAIGTILIPIMKDMGYKPGRAAGLVCAGAILGPIIPPSGAMILLGSTAPTKQPLSIQNLFMIGIVPGILIGLALMLVWFFIVRKDGYADVSRYTLKESLAIAIDSLPAIILPVILLGGIRLGIFTPTESGAFAAVYAILISTFWYKELNIPKFMSVCANAAKTTSVVMLIVSTATAVGWYITIAQIPASLASNFDSLIDNPTLLLLTMNVFLFVIGMVMDLTPNILIFGPVLYPIVEAAGINTYFFGLIFVLNMCIGVITPPVGTVLYVACSVGKVKFGDVVRGIIPFLIAEMIMLFLLIVFPKLSIVPMLFFIGEL